MNSAGKRGRTGPVIIRMLAIMILLLPLSSMAGSMEPPAAPGQQGTMKTLDHIPPTWSQKLPAADRFELVLDGEAVLDKETGLVWARDANLTGGKHWSDSRIWSCYNATIGGRKGWRMPTVDELLSLVDPTQNSPALPIGHPFTNVQTTSWYWSRDEASIPDNALAVRFNEGDMVYYDKDGFNFYSWPVRGDN